MPTRDVDQSFWQDYDRLSLAQQRRFLRVLRRFIEDADTGARAGVDLTLDRRKS